MQEYQSQFKKLLNRVGKLNQSQQVACFIGGLKEGVRIDVQAMKPPTLSETVGLARLYEVKYQKRSSFNLEPKRAVSTNSIVTSCRPSSTPTIQRLSPMEMKEHRDKGLCFNCDEKFALGHRCKKLFFIERCWLKEDSGDGIGDIEEKEDSNELEISLHAMASSPTPQTMQIHGVINQQSLVVLINSGSTHNFIEESLAEKLGLTCNMEERFNVKVACSERISCKGRCIGVQVRIQGVTLDIDFYLLRLEGYEVILGAQWLRTLEMIELDFSKLLMRFQYGGNNVERILKGSKHGAFIQFHAIAMGEKEKMANTFTDQNLIGLINSFQDLFKEPKGLPPSRVHDHCTPLVLEIGSISVMPYRYPHFQKTEIEQQVEEMLKFGIIRPSNNPYSSPVLLVKKSDGSWRMRVDCRALNHITVKDKFPIPVIDELLDELHATRYFSDNGSILLTFRKLPSAFIMGIMSFL